MCYYSFAIILILLYIYALCKHFYALFNISGYKTRKPPKVRTAPVLDEPAASPATEADPTPGQSATEQQEENQDKGASDMPVDDTPAKSIDSLIIDPHEAKLPPTWKWLTASASEPDAADPITKTVVKVTLEHEEEIISKSVSFSGNQVFYRVKGFSVSRPFLRGNFHSVSDVSDLLVCFDDATICVGCDVNNEDVLRSFKDAVRSSNGWRAKCCVRVLQKGSVCYRCDQVNKKSHTKMDQLAARKKRDETRMRNLVQKLKRTQELVKVSIFILFMC